MKLDYGTQLSYSPIKLSIGRIRKPTLRNIADISFDVFDGYKILLKLTPKDLLSQVKMDEQTLWDKLAKEEQDTLSMMDLISIDNSLSVDYMDMFNFFFCENVAYDGSEFILHNNEIKTAEYQADIEECGRITKKNYKDIIYIIQQICCIDDKDGNIEDIKFKNAKAKALYEKMKKSENNVLRKHDKNMTIPNIISSVSSRHNSINLTNVWDMTVFQLVDTFNRLKTNEIYDINAARVSAWGDEKRTFDDTLWYKNEFD